MAALKTAIATYPHTRALKDGTVKTPGVELEHVEITPIIAAFRRMCRSLEFDVCEMAITTYLTAKAYDRAFTALPVFIMRQFHHSPIVYNVNAGVRSPKDLEGKRVGVRAYTVTTGVWVRGILASEYGVDLDSITWVRSDDEHVAEFVPPPNVEDLPEGIELTDLPAVVGDVKSDELVPLIADAQAVAERALADRGLWPVNHLVVVKDEVLDAHPDVAGALVDAFEGAKQIYLESGDLLPLHLRVQEIIAGDPLPYGLEPNRAVVEQLIDHCVAQRILRRRPSVNELFVNL
jgi:4,5-dihydroxyphthalate decarboxylase